MIKNILTLAVLLSGFYAFPQFYISTSGGFATGSAEVKLGEIVTVGSTEASYGSYGEGLNLQLRAGYFFNDTFGVDIGIGYLYGSDQTVTKVTLPSSEVDAIARGRAFGLSPSLVYKFTKNLYGRFGALLKIGGRTEAVVYNKQVFSDAQAAGLGLPSGSYSETNFVENFHGRLPLGFTGSFGYKHDFADNFAFFIEAEYFGISIKRDYSELQEFNTNIVLPDGTVAIPGFNTLDNLPDGFNIRTDYVDELSNTNTDSSIELAQSVPYSSFGVNIGVTYNFGKKKKATN